MPFDAFFLSAVAAELSQTILDARIDRVQQPQRDAVILQLRSPQAGNCRLLLTASANHPRIHLTEMSLENPAQPPMFCMFLRKHLTGARIVKVVQPPLERVLELQLRCTDELGEVAQKRLILEIMGRSSNLILVGEDGRILDCLRRVDFSQSQKRQVLPGLFYQPPVPLEKQNPLTISQEALTELLLQAQNAGTIDRWLLDTFTALPPLICRELSFGFSPEGALDLDSLPQSRREQLAAYLASQFGKLAEGKFTPTMLVRDSAPFDFTYRPIAQYGPAVQCVPYPSFSGLLDAFYGQKDRDESMRQRSQSVHKLVTNLFNRTKRKLAIQEKELEATLDRERLRQLGDIVTANLHAIQRGQPQLEAVDFYDPEMAKIRIPLSPQLSPQQNAAKYYKDYTKAKHAQQYLTQQIQKGTAELHYLSSVLEELSRAQTEKDLQEIRQELTEEGYLRQTGSKKRQKLPASKPMEFCSSDGFPIYVGRNNRQNDQLTTKMAYKSDLWLHTQKIPGSHVIIACGSQTPPERTVTEAAILAAWFSQARNGQNVAVDCALVKHVKKPNGAKPGMVIYDHYTTVYVTPSQALAEQLRANPSGSSGGTAWN